jgi:hypothetical protein
MSGYEPVTLADYCNTGTGIYGENKPKTGRQVFHGLPFEIGGADSSRALLGFGEGLAEEPVSIPIGKTARNVIFAHALLDSKLEQGGPVGRLIATYVIRLTDGTRFEAPIRERFEIAVIPVAWGMLPFASLPDNNDSMQPRYEGRWDAAGNRQTEGVMGWPSHYYLWNWPNPNPETAIESIEICPAGGPAGGPERPRFVLAAITLGHADEEPFRRTAALPLKLMLHRAEDAAGPFALDVKVDRGVAAYPFALPAEPGQFPGDAMSGWGEEQNASNSPAYVEIAATPSATVSVEKGGEELASAQWGDITRQGVVETERVRFEVVDTGRNWVHTTVLDDETGRPVPCRIHFRTPDGIPYAPHGHHAHVNSNNGTWNFDVGGDLRLSQITYAYTDGKCQGWLPRGEVIVDVARGYEYEPLREKVTIAPGQRELTLRLKRKLHLNAERYFSGDTHVHFLSSAGALLEASAEDLDVVNLLQSQWGSLFTSTEEFTGRPAVSADGGTIVYASQENRQHILGHMSLLGLKEPVMPWCSDGADEAEMGGNMETTLARWADACHEQGGVVVLPHAPNPNGEPAALIATGRADALEMAAHNPFFHLEYYRYLNAGYRLPIAGGTDKMDSGVPVGLYRTYVYIPPDQEFNYENWTKALKRGNTFLSGGPVLRFRANGQPIGSTLELGADGGTVEVEASVSSIFPVHTLQIVQGGEVVAQVDEPSGARELSLRTSLRVSGPTWLCARCGGPDYSPALYHFDSWRRGVCAHTSPIYVSAGTGGDLFNADTMMYMLTLINGSLERIRRAPQWKPGTVTHHHGHEDHQQYLEEPFQQAIAAIHRRMHQHGIPH